MVLDGKSEQATLGDFFLLFKKIFTYLRRTAGRAGVQPSQLL